MKLYFTPGACSLSPHIVLREAGQKFDLVQVDLKTKKTKAGDDYTKVNPNGYVPALQLDDGSVLTEGPAMVQYIADRAAGSGLAPASGTMERYRLQEWLNFIGTELHKGFSPLFNPALPADFKPVVLARLKSRLAHADKALAGKQYLTGNTFTVADAYLFTITTWGGAFGIDYADMPNIKAFRDRVGARPAVQAALKAEADAKAAA
jgi:glutathione S-transferase